MTTKPRGYDFQPRKLIVSNRIHNITTAGRISRMESFVLITGLGRSGSTIVQRVLSQHENVNIADEAWHVFRFANMVKRFSRSRELMGLSQRQYLKWAGDCIYNIHRLASGSKQIVGDKCPPAVTKLTTIQNMFAEAQIPLDVVFTMRHPYDIAISWFERFGQSSHAELSIYSGQMSNDTDFKSIAKHVLAIWQVQGKIINDTDCPVIRYEDLVVTPSKVLAPVFNALDLLYSNSFMVGAFSDKPVVGGDPKFNRTSGLHQGSIFRHTHNHCKEKLRTLMSIWKDEELRQTAERFHYEL